MTRLQDYDTSHRVRAKVIETRLLTPSSSLEEVRELTLEITDPAFETEIGQSVGVLVPGPHELGHDIHFRLYSVAGVADSGDSGHARIEIAVRLCTYVDEYSGEEYKGIASHYLCHRQVGDEVLISGPYGLPFRLPEENNANFLLIGLGTGIAPFRAFVEALYRRGGDWHGKVRLFYGAKSGLEMLYMNDETDDFAKYYDEKTFRAFKAVSPRPALDEPIALDSALDSQREEVWEMVCRPETYVYVAGLEQIRLVLEKAFVAMAGGAEAWDLRKKELIAAGRWVELVY